MIRVRTMCAGWKWCKNTHIVSSVARVLLSIRELMRSNTNLLLNSAIRYTVSKLSATPMPNAPHPSVIHEGICCHSPMSKTSGRFVPSLKDMNQKIADITATTGKVNLLVATVF